MSCLVYCIYRARGPQAPGALPAGVDGAAVSQVAEGPLCAAVSRVPSPACAPDLKRAVAFERVVQALFQGRTLIPMRYGCVLEDAAQVRGFLAAERTRHLETLQRLHGCVEMGVRVLLDGPGGEAQAGGASPAPEGPQGRAGGPGRRFLEARRAVLEARGASQRDRERASGRCLGALEGLCREARQEGGAPDARMLSLVFLVPRAGVALFRERFRALAAEAGPRMLLSGPWPPYSFVVPEIGAAAGAAGGEGGGGWASEPFFPS